MSDPRPPTPVSDLLARGITIRRTLRRHPVGAYAAAFRDSPLLAVRVVGTGYNSISLELDDGTVLKITTNFVADWIGTRPFDVPVLARGSHALDGGLAVNYFIQPTVATPVTTEQLRAFLAALPAEYLMTDRTPANLGVHEGEVRLLDPWAVRKLRPPASG